MKKLYLITAAVAIAILAAFNVNAIWGNKQFCNINLKHVESMADGENPAYDNRELKSFQCDNGTDYYDQCSINTNDGKGCQEWEETSCPVGSSGTDTEMNETCKKNGHYGTPYCTICGWPDGSGDNNNGSDGDSGSSNSYRHSFQIVGSFYFCEKCHKTQPSPYPSTGCIR